MTFFNFVKIEKSGNILENNRIKSETSRCVEKTKIIK